MSNADLVRTIRAMQAEKEKMKKDMEALRDMVHAGSRSQHGAMDDNSNTTAAVLKGRKRSKPAESDMSSDMDTDDEMDEGPPFKSVKAILRFFSRKNEAAIDELENAVKSKVRAKMADESEERAAEMLPGRVVSLLVDRRLMETMSFPHPDG